MGRTIVNIDESRLSLAHDNYIAVFVKKNDGWHPDWIYLDGEKAMRFKDHEWISIGHLRSPALDYCVIDSEEEKGIEFIGCTDFEGVPVDWTVAITASPNDRYFRVKSVIIPRETVELVEAFTSMELPNAYSGMEDALCMIGQNPVTHWKDGKAIAQERYWLPQWVLTRKDSARNIIPSMTPIMCFRVFEKYGDMPVYVSFVGDWNKSCCRSLFMTPTSYVRGKRGYKFIVGAHNWSSAIAKDPNMLFEKGVEYTQEFYFNCTRNVKSIDDWYHETFIKGAKLHFPEDGIVESYERAKVKYATVGDGCRWLVNIFNSEGYPGLYEPEKGVATYIAGTRPKNGDWGKIWLNQLIGPLGYYYYVTGEEGTNNFCKRHKSDVIEVMKDSARSYGHILTIPTLYYAALTGDKDFHNMSNNYANETINMTVPKKGLSDVGDPGELYRLGADNGLISLVAEGLLKSYEITGKEDHLESALSILERMNADLDHRFWYFGYALLNDTQSGGQIRPLGLGHATMANVLAYEAVKDEKYLDAAERCAKYLVSICYSIYSNSKDPDFDYRGFANGAIAGRDLTAEYPPWETSESMLCVANLLKYRKVEGAYYILWYLQRTYPAAFPAARELKKYYNTDEKPIFRKMSEVASEKNIALRFPFLAYECPYDQTLQSCYQGVNPILNYLTYCGGLVEAEDDRILAIVPSVSGYDKNIRKSRNIQLFNPLNEKIETGITLKHIDESENYILSENGIKRLISAEELKQTKFKVNSGQVLDLNICSC